MKIRLAKKIMKARLLMKKNSHCVHVINLPYWKMKHNLMLTHKSIDHRITKAINLSAKCKARDILHNIEKNGCRTPFNQKNVESCRRKVESYKV